MIAQGVDVRTVASLLGHSQTSTTLDIYAYAFDKKKREAQEKLGQVMGVRQSAPRPAQCNNKSTRPHNVRVCFWVHPTGFEPVAFRVGEV